MNEKNFRKNLVELLKGGGAHIGLDKALEGLNPTLRTIKPAKGLHSVWELLEHVRIGQEDILRYTLDPKWISLKWPDEYWPSEKIKLTDDIWEKTIRNFKSDLNEIIKIAEDTNLDLTSEIPHGEGRTYLRELLLVADHNAYHVGQIVQTRKSLNNW